MNIRALIAEDEPILAATLARSLQRLWPELEIVATAPNGVAAVEQALALKPDVLFLDIKMPGQTGLEAAEELAERWEGPESFPQVVFVTAYDEYAVRAFEQAAADYVLKPANEARLARTVERLRALVKAAGLPTVAPDLGVERWIELMEVDKKNEGGAIKFILLKPLGSPSITSVPEEALRATLAACVGGGRA